MSATSPPKPRRLLLRLVWTSAALVIVVGLVRTFVLGIYRVDSTSMAPFLHGDPRTGEWVAVWYGRPKLERFDPIVILREGEREPVVKRVVGLPRETVQISAQDLVIDGRRLPADAPRLPPLVVFDEGFQPLEGAFQLTGTWEREDGFWRMAARSSEPSLDVSAAWKAKLLDERLTADGESLGGRVEVGDALLELEIAIDEPAGRLGLRLSEEGDRFEVTLEPDPEGSARATLWRRSGRATAEPLGHVDLPLRPGTWHRLRFSNVDNRLALEFDGTPAGLSADYESNTPLGLGGAPDPSHRHLMPRVAFWASGLDARVRSVRILRDAAYTDRGEFAVLQPLTLGPDEVFVLGDNSSESLDSRELGPVRLEEVLGVPLAVVWPPSAWRRLGRLGAAR